MRISARIQKFDPEKDAHPYEHTYRLDIAWRGSTVLDTLFQIKNELDGALTFRYSCRSSICGSCSMVINGQEKLACKTMVVNEIRKHGELAVRPLRQMRILKDLVVDMQPFWHKVREITPWLVAEESSPTVPSSLAPPRVTEDTLREFHNVDACIMCGACVSACNSLEASPGFLGPAALAKAYRFVADPRDASKNQRLRDLDGENGIWDCTRCNFCVEVCPKDVKPMEAIIRLRREALQGHVSQTVGAHHIRAFMEVVQKEGRLNEGLLPVKMLWKRPRLMLRALPLAFKMFLRGKLPFPHKRPIKGIEGVRRLFETRRRSAWKPPPS
jgi:succinate dehydrogenase / fumarate reductase, iron-sulfur subunit